MSGRRPRIPFYPTIAYPSTLIILGIDPSSTSTGFGLIHYDRRRFRYLNCGTIRTKTGQPFDERLVTLYQRMAEIVAETRPDEVAIESTFHGKDPNAVARLGETRGVLCLAVKQAALPLVNYAPAEVKKAVAGSGRATKEQVQFMITKLLKLKEAPRPLDASDALAVALCHAHNVTFRPPSGGRRPKPEIEALLMRASTR